eukprot:scpid14106/ scgid23590/ 
MCSCSAERVHQKGDTTESESAFNYFQIPSLSDSARSASWGDTPLQRFCSGFGDGDFVHKSLAARFLRFYCGHESFTIRASEMREVAGGGWWWKVLWLQHTIITEHQRRGGTDSTAFRHHTALGTRTQF